MIKVVRLTESNLVRLVKRTIMEMEGSSDKLNPRGFEFAGEKNKNEYYVQGHQGFKILLITTPKQTSEMEDYFQVKCMLTLPGGEYVDIGQDTFGKSVLKVSGNDDDKLKKLINNAKNTGEFRRSYDNTPRMK